MWLSVEGSWLDDYCPDVCAREMSLWRRYLVSLYWSVTTMMTVSQRQAQ
jgi:hypothetical protein